jgi:putative transposase
MDEDNVVSLRRPDDRAEDPLTEVLRHGARTLLAQAIEAEVATFLASHADLVDQAGRRRLVRNGFLPERTIQTGIGEVPVRQPRVRDHSVGLSDGKIRFTSAILPRYLRRRGISTFGESFSSRAARSRMDAASGGVTSVASPATIRGMLGLSPR